MGGLVLAYCLAHPQDTRVDALILLTPGVRANVDLHPLKKAGVLLAVLLHPTVHFDIPIETELFTTNQTNLDLIRRDPLRLHEVSARFFWESLRLDRFIDRHIRKNRLPTLLLLDGQDRIIDNQGVIDVLRKANQKLLEIHSYEEQTHAIQLDAPNRLVADMVNWIERAVCPIMKDCRQRTR